MAYLMGCLTIAVWQYAWGNSQYILLMKTYGFYTKCLNTQEKTMLLEHVNFHRCLFKSYGNIKFWAVYPCIQSRSYSELFPTSMGRSPPSIRYQGMSKICMGCMEFPWTYNKGLRGVYLTPHDMIVSWLIPWGVCLSIKLRFNHLKWIR